jgi:hypothetical protein
VLVQTGAHKRLMMPTAAPMPPPRINWEQDPDLEPVFNPVLGRIRILAKGGLTSMMVLHDYVSKRIVPLQEHTRLAWLYIGVNHITRLECDDRYVLGEEALTLVMGKLSPDPSSHDFVTPPTSCQPLCMDQAVRTLLLVAMPLMDDISIASVQRGDQSRDVQIPKMGVAGGQGGAVFTPAPIKNKGKVVRVVHSDNEVSTDDDVPLQRRRRVADSSKSMADGTPLVGTVPRPDSSAAAQAMAPRGSDDSLTADGTTVATRATAEKEVADAATAKRVMDDATMVKKAIDEAAAVKRAVDDTTIVGSGSSSAPSVGAKRAAVPSSSTPLTKL